MNYMKDVAKLLGVEPNERFRISNNGKLLPGEYYFTDNAIRYDDEFETYTASNEIFRKLVCGEYEIVQAPWIPKDGEPYYYVFIDPLNRLICEDEVFDERNAFDIMALAFGNCFRTYEDAEAHIEEIGERLKETLRGNNND